MIRFIRTAAGCAAIALALAGSAWAQVATGQVWTFKDASAPAARVVIQKIEPWAEGREVVHISLYGLPAAQGFNGEVAHLPFDRTALEASLDTLTGDVPPQGLDIAEGYGMWKEAQGGIFTIPLAEAVQAVLDMAKRRT